MKRRRRHLLALIASSVAVAACADQTPSPLEAPRENIAATASPQQARDASEQFTITIAASGSFAPGTPVSISAVVTGNMETPQAILRIDAPESEVAKASGWGRGFRPAVGRKLQPVAKLMVPIDRDEQRQISGDVVFDAPGLYHVVATAMVPAEAVHSPGIQDEVHRELWLLIDEKRGRVLPGFSATEIPDGFVPEPGPFRSHAAWRSSGTANASGVRPSSVAATSTEPITVITYDQGDGRYQPIARANVTIYEWDASTNTGRTYYTITDSTGTFVATCPADQLASSYYRATVYLQNELVYDAGYRDWPATTLTASGDYCGTHAGWSISTYERRNHVFANLTKVALASPQKFGYQMSRVMFKQYDSNGNSGWTSNNWIDIYDNSAWGQYGRYTAAHEYGHAFNDLVIGGFQDGPCPGTLHYFDAVSDYDCAYEEGFGAFFGATINGTPNYPIDFEAGAMVPACVAYYNPSSGCPSRQSAADGKQVEGAVAQVMWDMVDPATSDDPYADDGIRVSAYYLVTVMRTCRLARSDYLAEHHPTGIDELLLCLGQSTPLSDFPRVAWVTTAPSVSPGPSDVWSYDAMQRIWKWNLFRRT